jgi:hypothetical protein
MVISGSKLPMGGKADLITAKTPGGRVRGRVGCTEAAGKKRPAPIIYLSTWQIEPSPHCHLLEVRINFVRSIITTDVASCFNKTKNVEVMFAKFNLSLGSTMVAFIVTILWSDYREGLVGSWIY